MNRSTHPILALAFVLQTVYASPSSIADRLYDRYGDFTTTEKTFTRSVQADLVHNWIARYADGTHPLAAMENMISSRYAMNASELSRFNCQSVSSGYRCTDFSPGHGHLMLNSQKQARSGDLCIPMPAELVGYFRTIGGQRLVSFVSDLSVLAYGEQTRLFSYRAEGWDICARF